MPNLLTQHKVRNYDEWRPHFDRHEPIRVAAGITNPRVYRNASDPNDLVLLFDVADVEGAKQFGQSQDFARNHGTGWCHHAANRARDRLIYPKAPPPSRSGVDQRLSTEQIRNKRCS